MPKIDALTTLERRSHTKKEALRNKQQTARTSLEREKKNGEEKFSTDSESSKSESDDEERRTRALSTENKQMALSGVIDAYNEGESELKLLGDKIVLTTVDFNETRSVDSVSTDNLVSYQTRKDQLKNSHIKIHLDSAADAPTSNLYAKLYSSIHPERDEKLRHSLGKSTIQESWWFCLWDLKKLEEWLLGSEMGKWSTLFFIMVLSLLLGAGLYNLSGGAKSLGYDSSRFGDDLWLSWTMFIDIGTQTGLLTDDGTDALIVCVLISMMGFIFMMIVLGFVVDGVGNFMDRIKERHEVLRESGHTVIIGWSDKALLILDEMTIRMSTTNVDNKTLVILSTNDSSDVFKEIRTALWGTNLRVAVFSNQVWLNGVLVKCRKCRPTEVDDLRRASVHKARLVVVHGGAILKPSDFDEVSIRTTLALTALDTSHPKSSIGSIVVDVNQPQMCSVVEKMSSSLCEGIYTKSILHEIVSLEVLVPTVGAVLRELVIPASGNQLFSCVAPDGLLGMDFLTASRALPDVVLLGKVHTDLSNVRCVSTFNPGCYSKEKRKDVINAGDRIIFISKDLASVEILLPDAQSIYAEIDDAKKSTPTLTAEQYSKRCDMETDDVDEMIILHWSYDLLQRLRSITQMKLSHRQKKTEDTGKTVNTAPSANECGAYMGTSHGDFSVNQNMTKKRSDLPDLLEKSSSKTKEMKTNEKVLTVHILSTMSLYRRREEFQKYRVHVQVQAVETFTGHENKTQNIMTFVAEEGSYYEFLNHIVVHNYVGDPENPIMLQEMPVGKVDTILIFGNYENDSARIADASALTALYLTQSIRKLKRSQNPTKWNNDPHIIVEQLGCRNKLVMKNERKISEDCTLLFSSRIEVGAYTVATHSKEAFQILRLLLPTSLTMGFGLHSMCISAFLTKAELMEQTTFSFWDLSSRVHTTVKGILFGWKRVGDPTDTEFVSLKISGICGAESELNQCRGLDINPRNKSDPYKWKIGDRLICLMPDPKHLN